jgi:hypothetical protein
MEAGHLNMLRDSGEAGNQNSLCKALGFTAESKHFWKLIEEGEPTLKMV